MKIFSWIQHSFKRQIIFVLLCLMFFVTLLSISRLYYSGKHELAHILESQAFQLVDGLAITIENDVRYSNYFELSDTITHIYDNNHKLYLTEGDLFQVIDISVVDLENRTMAHSNPKEYPLQLKNPKIKEYEKLFKQDNSKIQFVWSEEDRNLHFRAPIYFGLEVIGVMYINVNPTSLIKGESILLKELLTLVFILIFLLIIFVYLFGKWIDKPLHDIISELDKLGNGEIKFDSLSKRKDEFFTLAKAIVEADSRICMQKEELLAIQENLHNQVKEEVDKNNEREKYLIQQSRLAQMGEMISMIAHQWRQPLGAISSTSINLQMKLELKAFDLDSKEGINKAEAYFKEKLENIDEYVHNLTTTIDDFRNFYKPNKKAVTIKLEEVILKSLNIIKKSLESDNIEVIEEYNSNEELEVHDNEMMQVILNILKNAQDNFMEKGTENPYIRITTNDKSISICDNGGGIPEDIIENIFDPYFSTKDDRNGTGLGLYMSKTIVEEHHNGKLSVTNQDGGACFTLCF